ncbi:Hemicentin 1 [Fasciola gigantica]|uniref:Hemicentin 1 n=1 Tax=Fasciola gigantica TaxID=46835 RepID=A0A504YJ55_FASGI|nr:Hemicentin 1 [Fasciola gigantica]
MVQGRVCLDVDECARPEVRLECARLGGVCTNRPGDYACLCRSGHPCLECNTTCPRGFWASGDCQRNQSIECKPCSGPCPTGMYEVQPCGPNTDRICQACRPLCISEEFEFTPCKASSNRVCKQKSLIPELNVPYKKNVWFENMQMVRDSLLILTPDDLNRLPANKSLLLDRSSGYQVRLDLDSLNLLPVLGPVDHSSGNDNALFLAAARVLDRTVAEPEAYRWSSATGQYHTVHAYSSKANNTLSKLCPYPVPPLYRLGILAHRNVTTATVPDTSLPGHRPVLASCRTYRRHGYFPPVDTQSDHPDSTASDVHSPMDAYSRQYANSMESGRYVQDATSTTASAPVVACLEPSRLPAIFGSHWNVELASPRAVYYEEKQLCGQLKLDCQHCLAACAEELKSSSLTCKPTSNPADNGRSPRLEICFDCCARDNCSDVCDKYPAHRCHMQMCHYGLRLDFPLTPEWPKQGEFLCHVHPAPSRPVYRLHWSLLYQGRPLTPDRFPASLVLSTPNADGERRSSVDAQSSNERYHLGQGGQLNQIYRGLLNVRYTSGLEHLPDMIGGTDTMQSAYFWSKQTIPLVSGSATNTAFDPIASATSAAATGAIYANTMQSSSSHELSSVQVWPSQPLGVSTAAWARLSGAPCAAADPLLEQLNVYTPALPPYIAMGEAKLTFSLPRSASLLGAVFSPASVERGQYLRASLALAWVSGATSMDPGSRRGSQFTGTKSAETPESFETNSFGSSPESGPSRMQRYWVIDLTGQVDQFPGLFRLRVYPDNGDIDSANPVHASSRFLQREFSDATVEVEDEPGIADVDSNDPLMANEPEGEPLIEYDVGVFEERKFQLRILIPGPETEPDYEKAFRLIILDAKNRLDIRVKRAVQPPNEMALRRSYERLIDDDMRPALVDLLPSLAARQQAMWLQASHAAQENNVNSHRLQSDSKTDGTENPDGIVHHLPQFGPPPSLVYAVVFALLCMLLFLLIGLVMQADPTLSWIKLSRCDESTINRPGNSVDGDRVALVPNPARLCHNNRLSRWCRVLLLIGYLCLKSAYTFGVTLTALVIIIRYVTREPADRLANLPEWNGVGDQPGEFMGTSLTRQKLLQDAMDVHLRAELIRQQTEARRIRDTCDRGIEAMFDQMESRLDAASKLAASRRSRVLLSQAVAELARATALSSTLQLAEGLIAFNQTAEWALHRLKSDLGDTERALGNSDWLTGARIIYAEVVRLRGLTPDPADPTRSFLNWAKLTSGQTPHGVDELDSVFGSSMQHRAMLLPLLQPDQFRIPTPPLLTHSDSGGSGSSTGLVADADEPEYGPKYVPFVPTSVDAEVNEAFWSSYDADSNPPSGIGMDDVLDTSSESDKTGASSGTSPGTAGMNSEPAVVGSMASAGFMLSNLQLGWVHVLGAALLLDALWLIHRVLHTVDTAERILYGDIIFIDLTAEGIRKRLSQKNRLRSGCKHAFETAMQPGAVRKLCGGVLALLIVSQTAAHLDRLLSQDTLDYIGYYDNLILPVHLHARLVNVHVSRSAQRLNQYDMAGLESEVSRRLREAQFLLHQWTAWLKDIEQEQCRLLLAYKASAQQVRTKMAAKINRNPGLSKLQLPIHVIHSQSQTGSSYGYSSGSPGWSELRAEVDDSRQSASPEALVPRHCRLTQPEQELELAESRQLDPPHCPLSAIVPVLFKGYNASDYFTEVVKQSESWLSAARDYLGRTLYCIFVYVSALVLWNTVGSVIWFYLDRLNVLPKKVLFESDPSSWNLPESVQQL